MSVDVGVGVSEYVTRRRHQIPGGGGGGTCQPLWVMEKQHALNHPASQQLHHGHLFPVCSGFAFLFLSLNLPSFNIFP